MLKSKMILLVGTVFLAVALAMFSISFVSAMDVSTSSYSVDSTHLGSAGNEPSTASFTSRATTTYQQAGTKNANTANYTFNSGWLNVSVSVSVQEIGNVTINDVFFSNDSVFNNSNVFDQSQITYDTNLNYIGANCTAQTGSVNNVTFRLFNVVDNVSYINTTGYTYRLNESGNLTDLYILNSSYVIRDSGNWTLFVNCSGSSGSPLTNTTLWEIDWGTIQVNLINPIVDTTVTIYEFFTFTTNVSCSGGECGMVNVTLDPENTNKTITINLNYKSGTQWDSDDDGVETINGVVDLTVENSLFNFSVNESDLCTIWETYSVDNETSSFVCYGTEQCCNVLSLIPISDNWNDVFNSFYGKLGAGYSNIIRAQIISVDYNLSLEQSINIYYSGWASLNVEFYDINETIEQNQTQQTTLAGTTYAEGETIEEDNKQLGEKIVDEPDYETHFLSIDKTNTSLIVIFYHDYNSTLPVKVEGNVTYNLTKETADYLENITLTVNLIEGIIPRFELHVGANSEIFEFGKIITIVNIENGTYKLEDRDDTKLNVHITKNNESIEIRGIEDQAVINAKIEQIDSAQITTSIAAVESINIEQATIILEKTGPVNTILRCDDDKFNYSTIECSEWTETKISFYENDSFITFTVAHFTAYAGGNTSSNETGYLTIWDENDVGMPNASQTRLTGQQVLFFADYKASQNGTKITDANCSVSFNNGAYNNMTYNASYTYYLYNRSFDNAVIYSYNVRCTSSGYPDINATDTISILSSATKSGAVSTVIGAVPFYTTSQNPQICNVSRAGDSCISIWNVNATGILDSVHTFFVDYNMTSNTAYVNDTQSSAIQITIVANDTQKPTILSTTTTPSVVINGSSVTLFATASDNVQVDTVWANVTLPDNSSQLVINLPDSFTNTTQVGTYNVTFYANDTSGNTANATDTFTTAFPINITINVNVTVNVSANVSFNVIATIRDSTTKETLSSIQVNGSESIRLPNIPVDLEFSTTFNDTNLITTLFEFNLTENINGFIEFSNPSLDEFLVTYAVNTTFTFNSAQVVVSYANKSVTNENNLQLHKCDNFVISSGTCSSGFNDVTSNLVTTHDKDNDRFIYNITSFSGFGIKEVTPPSPAPSPAPSGGGGGGGGGLILTPGKEIPEAEVTKEEPLEEEPTEESEVEEIPEPIEEITQVEPLPAVTGAVTAETVIPLAANQLVLIVLAFLLAFFLLMNYRFNIMIYRKPKRMEEAIKRKTYPKAEEQVKEKIKPKPDKISQVKHKPEKEIIDELKEIYK